MINHHSHNAISCIMHDTKSSAFRAQRTLSFVHNARMTTESLERQRAKRLRQAREKRFATATDGWKHVKRFTDVGKDAYIQHENGNRGFKARATEYAKAFGVHLGWLISGDGPMDTEAAVPDNVIPIAGYVAANGADHFISDYTEGDGHDFIDAIIEDATAAFIVGGESMMPRYRPGDKIIIGKQSHDPSSLIGKDVVTVIKGDNRRTLKTLRLGRDGLWTLRSINPVFEPIEDVELEWVAPVEWVKV